MTPVKFKESNRTLGKPESMTDEECSSLEVFTDESICISCWQMNLLERLRALLFGKKGEEGMKNVLKKLVYYWHVMRWMWKHREEPNNRAKWRRMSREIDA